MAEETNVLEPPTEAQTAVQAAFDRATAVKSREKAKIEPPKEEKAPEKPKEEVKAPVEPKAEKQEELKLPSFVIGEKPKEVEPELKIEDLPKEAPEGSDEKTKINWKKTRKLLETQDSEIKALREKQQQKEQSGKQLSAVDAERLKALETENTQYKEQLQRLGIQQHPEFVNKILRPLQSTYAEAKRIITEAGGNPQALDRALTATGKAHYDAMDEIMAELPESAKGELNVAMRDYRRLSQERANAVANAPKALEELQKQDALNQKQFIEGQKVELEKKFEDRVKFLRDNARLETLMETQEEGATWWNEIPQKVIKTARMIALENQDMDIVMDASILAASAMSFRDMYQKERTNRIKAEKELSEIKGAEPSITDSGNPPPVEKEDLDRPFGDVFLDVLKKQKEK